jgi:hypothetical protein
VTGDDGHIGGIMTIGETVQALVNDGVWSDCQVIAIYGDMITVAGMGEVLIAAQSSRPLLGICLPVSLIRAKI